jgi:hypothetical protein
MVSVSRAHPLRRVGRPVPRLLLVLAAVGAGLGGESARAAVPTIPLDDIREGMTGYGLTVFHGTRVDTFGVRVLGVQRHARVAGNVILVEVSGPGLAESAIPQGMSGSPVYLDGRFAGAVAFSWEGALRPIGGLTPAAEMLALPAEPLAAPPEQLGAGSDLPALLDPFGRGRDLAARLAGRGDRAAAPRPRSESGWLGGTAWPSPALLAARLLPGLTETGGTGAPGLCALLPGWHCRALGSAAVGTGAAPIASPDSAGASPALVPGGACAVALVLGDAELGAIGTVSWRDGDRVGLFGHPLLQAGPVALPLVAAEVVGIFPSRQMSFKMGGMGAVVGAVHHDLRSGLAGRLGAVAPLVPVAVTVSRPGGEERYAFQVARDARLTPQLVYWCLYNTLLARGDDLSRQTIRYRIDADWRAHDGGTERCASRGVIAGPGSAAAMAPDWSGPLQAIFENRNAPLTLAGVTAVLQVTPGLEVAVITGAEAAPVARAGETWTVTAHLQPWRGGARLVRRELALPARLAPGRYHLLVASARDVFALETQRAAERFADRSLAATLDLLRTPRSAGDLEFVLYAPGRGVTVDGREFADLPGSVAEAFVGGTDGRVAPTLADLVLRVSAPDGPALEGAAMLALTVLPAAPAPTPEGRP